MIIRVTVEEKFLRIFHYSGYAKTKHARTGTFSCNI